MAFIAFFAICLAVDIISNLTSRYSDREPSATVPPSFAELNPEKLKGCLIELRSLYDELLDQGHRSISFISSKEIFITQWRNWSRNWQERYDNLGQSCQLSEYQYDQYPQLGVLAEIYRLLAYYKRIHSQLVVRFVAQSVQPIGEMNQLFTRASEMIR